MCGYKELGQRPPKILEDLWKSGSFFEANAIPPYVTPPFTIDYGGSNKPSSVPYRERWAGI